MGFDKTGSYCRPMLAENERICQVCIGTGNYLHLNEIESEIHLLFNCNRYENIRREWFEKMTLPPDFLISNVYGRLDTVLNHANNIKYTAQFIINALDLRSKALLTI